MSNPKDPFVEFQAGATVFKEGDGGNEMYVIESGQVDILHPSGNGEVAASFGPGDFFGEAAMLEDLPRHATALAKAATRLLRIERAAFAEVLRHNPEIAIRIMRTMMARQRVTEQRLHELHGDVSKPKAAPRAEPVRAPAPAAPPVAAPAPAPKAAPAPAPAPVAEKVPQMALCLSSGEMLLLDPARTDFLVGRPDPATGTTPEINLGPFDSNRTLSRRHARILRDGAQYSLREEAGVSNGTFVNGERVQSGVSVPLKPGDKLRFGMIEVEVAVA